VFAARLHVYVYVYARGFVDGGGGSVARQIGRETETGVRGGTRWERENVGCGARGGWRYIGMYFSRKAAVRGGRQRGCGEKEGDPRGLKARGASRAGRERRRRYHGVREEKWRDGW